MARFAAILLALWVLLPLSAAADTYLLMAEQTGCSWCERWNAEIADIYPKTVEGQTAPLRRYDIHGDKPVITFVNRVHFTPTFILVQDGHEVGRMEGYAGEDFFWGLLNKMLENAKIPLDHSG